MKIIFNGKSMDIEDDSNVLQCLLAQKLDPDKVVVERNENIVPSKDFAMTILQENDILEVLHFVGGG